ncbi:hypothetical protein [Mucilaginibacter dorajii]|uniref:hypothetical protein n=1 Tax=Mucilaginibacter dorajii TaxID=692994 RepID=UPI002168AD9D|nr:hypothetical protein [Mucilaginibacter dorajii]MCS3737871.1 hypothetical protein [Mucilaginibacter dorajii]
MTRYTLVLGDTPINLTLRYNNTCDNFFQDYGIPADRSGPRFPFIHAQGLRRRPVSTSIANAGSFGKAPDRWVWD